MSVIANNIVAGAAGQGGADAAYQIDRSLRFNTADTSNLERTPSSAGNRRTLTMSFWIKLTGGGTYGVNSVLEAGLSGSGSTQSGFSIRFTADQKLQIFEQNNNSITWQVQTSAVYRDYSSWYSVVVALDTTQSTAADRVKIWVNGEQVTSFSTASYPSQNYESNINKALPHRIGASDSGGSPYLPMSAYLADVHFIDGVSGLTANDFGEYDSNNVWQPKAYAGTYGTNGFHLDFSDNSSNAALGDDSSGNNNDWTVNNLVATSQVWSDLTTPSNTSTQFPYSRGFDGVITGDGGTAGFAGWLSSAGNITITFPSGVSVSNTINIYSGDGLNGSTTASVTVSGSTTTSAAASGYITNKSFSGISGDLESITLTNAGGGVRFYGIQIDGTTLVDIPGSDVDSLIDTPTNYEASSGNNNGGNYATLNPVDKGSSLTLSNGNLDVSKSGTTWANAAVRGTIGVSSGKWYWEITKTNAAAYSMFGVAVSAASFSEDYGAPNNETWTYISNSGNKFGDSDGGGGASYGATFTNGDVIGVALDMDAGTLVFYKNGSSQGTAYSTLSGKTIFPWIDLYTSGDTASVNFGQRPFAYTPPSGHLAVVTTSLTDPTIADGSTAMDVALYTGNGANTNTISGLSMSPDLVWLKRRDSASHHALYDAVRGAYKHIGSSHTAAEYTESTGRGLSAFNSDGFTIDTSNGEHVGNGSVNVNNATYAAWTWGGGSYPTNSSYNQTAKWSDDASGTLRSVAGNTHLGAFSGLENYNNTKEWTQIAGDNTWTFAPSGGISNVQGLKVLVFPRLGTLTINVNGSQVTTNTGNSLNTVDLSSAFSTPGTLNNITITSSGSGSYWGIISVQVDTGSGYKILADPGVDTNGSIASITRANQSAGFSIVSYTGNGSSSATVGHGLNASLGMIIHKNRDAAANWNIKHSSLASNHGLAFTTTQSQDVTTAYSGGGFANLTSSSTFAFLSGTSNANNVNENGVDYIAYCFTPVAGFSAFGTVLGTGSSDGGFAYTGFRPRFLLWKNADATGNWGIIDAERDYPDNIAGELLFPNLSNAELTFREFDFLSNGIKLRYSYTSGHRLVFMAFAENPFKYARAV